MKTRKIILASLMAATITPLASPVLAQDNAWTRNRTSHGRSAQPRNEGGQRERPAERPQQIQPQQQQQPRQDYRDRAQARPPQEQQRTAQQRPVEARQNWPNGAQNRRGDRRDDRQDNRQTWRNDRDDRTTERRADWNDRRDGNRTFGDAANANRRWDSNNRNDWRSNGRNDNRYDDRSRWANQRRWNDNWRNDNRYDWRSYRNRNSYIFRSGRYYAPRGWNYGYQSFSSGFYIDSMLYSQNYWLNDPYRYRLPPAYGSMRWVRYYDDALLIDMRDGYVVDVIRDFFW